MLMKEEFYQNTDYIELPEAWSDWKLTERIGTGSFGDVYLTVRGNEKSAVKVIRIPSDEAERSALLTETKNEDSARQYLKDLVENYTREIQAMYSLRDNPHIVRIEDHYIEELQTFGYRLYIRMELLTSLKDHIAGRSVTEGFGELSVRNHQDALRAHLDDRSTLIDYLIYLNNSGESTEKQRSAYEHFCGLLELTRVEVARMNSEDLAADAVRKYYRPEEITSADIEQVICSGIPVTKNGNLQKASSSLLSKQFHNFRLSRQRIDGVLKKQLQVDRYDLITLEFFLYSQKEYEFPEDMLRDFMDDMNRILRESGLKELHAVNPYEAFVLMCLLSEVPLATYADVWEMSFS